MHNYVCMYAMCRHVTLHVSHVPIQLALCDRPLREVSNPGASGSLFYLSADDAFILKTVTKKEARFLQKLLPGYYLVGGHGVLILLGRCNGVIKRVT